MGYQYCAVWHAHHRADSPLELIIGESFDHRMLIIDKEKAKQETPEMIARRKSLFKKVKGGFWALPLPLKIVCIKATLRIAPIWYSSSDRTVDKCYDKVMELHKEQCGCEWTPENNNIFDFNPPIDQPPY